MSFFAIVLALMLEQVRPLARDNPVYAGMRNWSGWSRQLLDAGQGAHGWLAWALAVLVPMLAATLLYLALAWVHPLLGFVWLVVVLHFTLGFRQFSHHFTAIRMALESGDDLGARVALARWKKAEVAELSRPELLRQVLAFSVLSAHRHVFGVLACFVFFAALGLGPAGAVAYRMAEHVLRRWDDAPGPGSGKASMQAARRAWALIDYLPARLTALFFAVVGNFEEAIANWRQEGKPKDSDALLVAACAGAMNVRLTDAAVARNGSAPVEARAPQLAHLSSLVGLVWRSVVCWLLLLALSMLARLM